MAKQNFIGLVVSQGKMSKTVKVRVQTKTYNKKIHKEVLKRKDYLVHDQGEICREGDIVRIESIPKISARKYFAIAEIKVNKGQQFARYEQEAKERLADREQSILQEFLDRKDRTDNIIVQVEDLRKLDQISHNFQSGTVTPEGKEELIAQIEEIKAKYSIKSWPTTEPVLSLEVSETEKDLGVIENRAKNIKIILDKLLNEEGYSQERTKILTLLSKRPVSEIPAFTQKNLLRKYILNPENECPVTL
ncbi:37S ribosomal protein S17 mitochondrial [Scheffersomyces spartinae]|uniref:37S ribosomal protein S17 mitochondrial n=1 Tax=Scheffersomyces spartinae TaxID=45513 RepID=A0A9P8AIP9_9ASCO|nr:37S ribosomal protein S17 mitochondrial [Scheffersomyces spartinae]KAG7193966.1 37S ribosomal protein S17 mitochondrial [Scheffersomyces spartinae]